MFCFFCNVYQLCTLQEFDKKYNPTWHCIVGRNFGSYVTHETKHFIYFYLGQVAILLFKSGWNPNARPPETTFNSALNTSVPVIRCHLSADLPTSWCCACFGLLLFVIYNTTAVGGWHFSYAWTGNVLFIEKCPVELLIMPAFWQPWIIISNYCCALMHGTCTFISYGYVV